MRANTENKGEHKVRTLHFNPNPAGANLVFTLF